MSISRSALEAPARQPLSPRSSGVEVPATAALARAPSVATADRLTINGPANVTFNSDPLAFDSWHEKIASTGRSAGACAQPPGDAPLTNEEWIARPPAHLPPGKAKRLQARKAKWVEKFVFEPRDLEEVASLGRKVLAETGSHKRMFDAMLADLRRRYPDKIAPGDLQWFRNQAGDAVGDIAYLHVSKHEYLIFFMAPKVPNRDDMHGTAAGFSGLYRDLDIYDFLVDGKVYTRRPGDMDDKAWSEQVPGHISFLQSGDSWEYKGDGPHFLEYGRGRLRLDAYWYGLFQSFLFESNDRKGAWKQLKRALQLRRTLR